MPGGRRREQRITVVDATLFSIEARAGFSEKRTFEKNLEECARTLWLSGRGKIQSEEKGKHSDPGTRL